MAQFYHFSFHSSIGHHGPKRTLTTGSEREKLPEGAVPETTSEMAAQDTTKRLLRKIDIRLVPILSALYLLCFLCRQNIGNAKTYHMTTDLQLTPKDYQIALTAFFFSYSTFDIPCNIMLKKLRPSVWLPLVTLLSGIVTTCMGVVKNGDELIVVRLFLGMTEVSLTPVKLIDVKADEDGSVVWIVPWGGICYHHVVLQEGGPISAGSVLLCRKVHPFPTITVYFSSY